MDVSVSLLSKKGSVNIPKDIRDHIEPRTKFLVFTQGEDIVLRKLTPGVVNSLKRGEITPVQAQGKRGTKKQQPLDLSKDPSDLYKDILNRAHSKPRRYHA
ncbi:MAG: hypothetical protein ABIA93_02895 [Candidatus Woesearchaeota archaeon]